MFNTPYLMIHEHSLFQYLQKCKEVQELQIDASDLELGGAKSVLQKQGNRAMISIEGPMMFNPGVFDRLVMGATSTLDIMEAVQDVANDSKIKSVVFTINSPGGEAHKIHSLADMVHELSQIKPTAALNMGVMASAAYHVGSQVNKIYVDDQLNLTGSIGTMAVLTDSSEAAKQAGVKVIPVVTGELKAAGMPGTEVDDKMIASVQKRVNELQSVFSRNVNRSRPTIDLQDGSTVRSGDVFGAEESLQLGLIDGVMSLDQIFTSLERTVRKNRILKK